MASFPDSVKSFTTKLDGAGNNINAAHVNDIQDEVNAIEAGLLNGTARLNSSHSTVSRLSVTGGSTLGGTLSVVGGSTFDATMQVVGGSTFTVRPVEPPPHAALVYLESSVSIGSSVLSTLSWNAQSILTNSSMHSTTTNPQRLTPQSTGLYRFMFQAVTSENSTGFRGLAIRDSSGNAIGTQTQPANTVAGNVSQLQVMGLKRFDALGGYAVTEFVNSGATSTLALSSGVGVTWFSIEKL